jgi:phage tail-like protein
MEDSARHDPATAYRFKVFLGNPGKEIGFQRVSGLKLSLGFEPLAVGGKNDGPVLLPVPVKEPGRVTFERGRKSADILPELCPGACLTNVAVSVLTRDGGVLVTYHTPMATVESLEVSELDALRGEILIEKYTLLHSGLELK